MQKPDKIYIQNPNVMYALGQSSSVGTIRKCFVANQLSVKHEVEYGKETGDFKVDGKYIFEVGGERKTFDQIANIPNSFILADAMEMPIGHKLPIWVAGLLY